MNKLKRNLWENKVRNVLKNKKREKKILSFDKIKSIAIVSKINDTDDFNQIDEVVKVLKYNNVDVDCKLIYDSKIIADWIDVKYSENTILSKDLNFIKIPKNNVLNEFYNTNFELLINFNSNNDFTSDYIIANSNASLIAGLKTDNNLRFADIQIDTTKKELINELKKYLNMLS